MIENYRTGMVWNMLRDNPHVVAGLRAAGFTGGWLTTHTHDSYLAARTP